MNKLPTIAMRCDFTGHRCLREVRRAPRIVVPSRTPLDLGHAPLRIMTTLHFCEEHRYAFRLESYWTDAIKARVEATARQNRPPAFKPDFERALLEMVLVTTPEYRQFVHDMGMHLYAA